MANAAGNGVTNHLGKERSPYLRQHAHNPVDWYGWGPEALERARGERKPILLSIGYAACHWCHVMAHESFEDASTAAVMNELFINIKVDREERPDLDRIYQLAHSVLTGRGGGWPLTMFLMHDDRRPFFGGTYFPKDARYGLPAFRDLLAQVARYYHEHLDELRDPAARVVAALDDLNPPPADDAELNAEPIRACRELLERSLDREYGGFGAAPKFPHPPSIVRLLHDWRASAHDSSPDLQALYAATLTLTRMATAGLFDQLGGGFFRYSVDARWEIPHFEKMLYDNAQLLAAYAEAASATGEALFRDIAERTAGWMLEQMRSRDGLFYSSLDADSDGHEGRFYVWTREEIAEALTQPELELVNLRYGLDQPANFEGRWHLIAYRDMDAVAKATQLPSAEMLQRLASAQTKLLAARSRRAKPGLDDKVLTSWNALAIGALAQAGRAFNRADFVQAATDALDQLRRQRWRAGRLLATDAGATTAAGGYLDDYVFLVNAILELASCHLRADDIEFACALTDLTLQHFQDSQGGFFFTADDQETLISRPKSFGDDALPAGNAIAARVLLRLGYLLGESRYLQAAERTLRAAWSAVEKYPQAHASLLLALEDYLSAPQIVLLTGPADVVGPWREQLDAAYAPQRWILTLPENSRGLPAALIKPATDAAVAYVCRAGTCGAPITSLQQLLLELG